MPFIIGALVVLYAAFVIYKKVKAAKSGKFCNCGCGDCPAKVKCMEDK
jgi:hypothetical protein